MEHHSEEHYARLEEIIEHLLKIIDGLLAERGTLAVKGELKIMPARILVGGKGATATYKELAADGVTVVKPSGPITFASDTPAVATVDGTTQVLNADNSVSVQVVAVAANPDGTDAKSVISGIDPASTNKVAAADVVTVGVAAGQVATSATLSLAAN